MQYDLIIVGGGPGGYTAAAKAARQGLSTLLIERRALGGVCLNEGCIPTKTLLYSAKLWHSMQHADKYGVKVSPEEFSMKKVAARKSKVVRKLVLGVKAQMAEAGVKMIEGEASFSSPAADGSITVKVGEESYNARHLLLATGSESVIPPIPGLDMVDYWTSREALDIKELPKSVAIVGGGVIGMEFAAFFAMCGVEVHVVEMLPEILGSMDYETSAMLREAYSKMGVHFYLEHQVTSVSAEGLFVKSGDESFTIAAERILISVGRRPNVELLAPLALEMQGRGVKVDSQMRTSQPNVWAIGDVTGFSLLAHTAVREGEVAIDSMLGKTTEMNYEAIPGVVYTLPEVAGVGKSEQQLQSEGTPYIVKKLPMTYSGRFVAENEQGQGQCKVLLDGEDHILGVHMIGNPCSELIVLAATAIEKGMTGHELASVVFPHPTVAEILKETLESSVHI